MSSATTTPDSGMSLKQARAAVFAAAFLGILDIFVNKCTNVMFPMVARDFRISLAFVQWMSTAYTLAEAVMAAAVGWMLAKIEARIVLRLASAASFIGIAVCATAVNFPMLLAGRIITGLGIGLAMSTAYFLVFSLIPKNLAGTTTGGMIMAISVVNALAPTYAGWVSDTFGWKVVFWTVVPFVVIAWLCGEKFVRNTPVGTDAPFDTFSLVLLIAAFLLFDVAASVIDFSGFSWPFWACVVGGLLITVAFTVSNGRGSSRLFDLDVLRNRNVRWNLGLYFLLQLINMGMVVLVPTYVQDALHLSVLYSGLILLPGSLLGAVAAKLSGRYADRHGYAGPVVSGSIVLAASLLAFALLQTHLTFWLTMLLYIFQCCGYSMTFSLVIADASLCVPTTKASDVSAVFNMASDFGASFGVSLLASLLAYGQDRNMAADLVTRTIAGGHIAYWTAFGVGVLILICMIGRHVLPAGRRADAEEISKQKHAADQTIDDGLLDEDV